MRRLPPTVRGTPQDGPVLRYAVQKGGGAPPRRTVQDGCHGKSTSISLSRGHPFAKIGGAYMATAMRSLLCGGCHAKSSCRHRAGCTLAEYVAPCIRRWPTVRHGQPHKGAGCTTWAPISARASLAGDGGDNSRSVRWYPAIKKASADATGTERKETSPAC